MISEDEVRAVTKAFADALDRSDFEDATAMLAPDCRYNLTSEETIVGPAAIVESYRCHDTRARNLFDRVEYFSAVESVDGVTAVIRFSDVLEKVGERHIYSCRQRIIVNESRVIDSIVHEDIPTETAAVRAFMERVGVSA